MSIFLGNLELKDIVREEYLPKIQSFLDRNGFSHTAICSNIKKKEGNYHIYEMPRQIHVCGEEKAFQLLNFLKRERLVAKAFIGKIGVVVIPKERKEKKKVFEKILREKVNRVGVTMISPTEFLVSSSRGDRQYRVRYVGTGNVPEVNLWECDCPAARFRAETCKHVRLVGRLCDETADESRHE